MPSKIFLYWILAILCIGIVSASTPKIRSTVHIPEDTEKGIAIAEISQLVKKHHANGLQKTYKILSQKFNTKPENFGAFNRGNEKWLEIGKTSGTVRLSKQFDRNAVCNKADECTIQTEIVILPHKIFQLVELEVIIDDVNDHNPVFPEAIVSLSLSENTLVDEVINLDQYQASDKDTGRNSILRYTMTSSANFRLEYYEDDKNSSHLRLHVTKSLDHETTPEITLDVYARDAGTPSLHGKMQIKITITDKNDNYPVFEKEKYVASLQENSPARTTIAIVKALDADSGLFGQIRYSISSRNNALIQKLVKIDEQKGVITLRESLDRETHKKLKILIEAQDSDPENPKTGETWLTININDINDNSPSISIDFITQSIGNTVYFPESTANGSYIAKVSIRDDDVGKNGEVDLKITAVPVRSKKSQVQKEPDNEFFTLTKDGYLISQQEFDRETCSRYRVLLEACDHGTPARCTKKDINVVILDVNEYTPDIKTTLKTVTLREDAYVGTVVAKIIATDGDIVNGYALTKNESDDIVRSLNGEITYSISRGNKVLFKIDKKSGKIRLSAPLDREKRDEWKLTVSVRDGGYPPLESFCTIIVKVTDVNDNAPIFINPGMNNSLIYADVTKDEVIMKIRARDFDAGNNGKVTYYIVPQPRLEEPKFQNKNLTINNTYFMLNPTNGDLRINFSKPNISNAIGIHNLIIKVKDAGTVPLETKIHLRVAVGEYGNGNMRFMDVEEASTSMNFLVLAISLGCATTFLLFLIIGIAIRCRRINREISSLTRKPRIDRQIDKKSVGSKRSVRDEIEVKYNEKEVKKSESDNVTGDKIMPKQPNSRQNLVLDLQMSANNHDDVAVPSDSDSGKGESDIEAASLLVNESKAYNQRVAPISKCTEKCRIYGHSDECWMPTKDEDHVNTTVVSQLTHYDWNRLKPRYFSSMYKNRQGSRCSYASTSNTDNDSIAPSAATSYHSVHQIVAENAKRQQLARGLEQLFASRSQRPISPHQYYPGPPLKYTNVPTKLRTQSCSSTVNQQLDALYEVNYSSRPNTAGVSAAAQPNTLDIQNGARFMKRHASYANDFEPIPRGTHI